MFLTHSATVFGTAFSLLLLLLLLPSFAAGLSPQQQDENTAPHAIPLTPPTSSSYDDLEAVDGGHIASTFIMGDNRTLEDPKNALRLQFSLWHESFQPKDAVMPFDPRQPTELQAALVELLEGFLCSDAQVQVSSRHDHALNICEQERQGRNGEPMADEASDSPTGVIATVVAQHSDILVVGGSAELPTLELLQWTEWTLFYPVLQLPVSAADEGIGAEAIITSRENNNDDDDDGASVAATEKALKQLQNITQSLFNDLITNYTMDERIQQMDIDAYLSPLHQEVQMFSDDEDWQGSTVDIHVSGFLLRVIGASMLVVAVTIMCCLTRLANHRRRKTSQMKEELENNKGGLVTEKGVNHMLEVGRRRSIEMYVDSDEMTKENDSDSKEGDGSEDESLPCAASSIAKSSGSNPLVVLVSPSIRRAPLLGDDEEEGGSVSASSISRPPIRVRNLNVPASEGPADSHKPR